MEDGEKKRHPYIKGGLVAAVAVIALTQCHHNTSNSAGVESSQPSETPSAPASPTPSVKPTKEAVKVDTTPWGEDKNGKNKPIGLGDEGSNVEKLKKDLKRAGCEIDGSEPTKMTETDQHSLHALQEPLGTNPGGLVWKKVVAGKWTHDVYDKQNASNWDDCGVSELAKQKAAYEKAHPPVMHGDEVVPDPPKITIPCVNGDPLDSVTFPMAGGNTDCTPVRKH